MDIKKKQTRVITINKKTFVVELRNVDDKTLQPTDAVETIGTGKSMTDAMAIATDYKRKNTEKQGEELNLLTTQVIEG